MNNFDEIIDRRNTNSIKYDFAIERNKPEDILPVWVADMDFRTPPEVISELEKAVQLGIFGYSDVKDDYFETLKNWFFGRFNWMVEKDWLVKTPGVVYALAAAVRGFTDIGDSVIIEQPVYGPFENVIKANDRKLVVSNLVLQNGRYNMNLADFEEKIINEKVKLFILCSPHNPVGRVWTRDELIAVSDICLKHKVIMVSDEIHCDFTYCGEKHTMLGSINEEILNNCVVCTAPSKTFNLAGLQASNIFIANVNLREKFKKAMETTGYTDLNSLGLIACKAAYEFGAEWLGELKKYLEENLKYVSEFIEKNIPKIKIIKPQGTYLVWLDCRNLNVTANALEVFMDTKAKLWFSQGKDFGESGEGFERMNIAAPRKTLETAMQRLKKAVDEL